jgi:hypothetical protein
MPKDKPKSTVDDRAIAAMRAISDRAEVFLLITAERIGDALPELKIYASDDYSHERLFNAAMMELQAAFPFANEVIDMTEDDDDSDDSDDEL